VITYISRSRAQTDSDSCSTGDQQEKYRKILEIEDDQLDGQIKAGCMWHSVQHCSTRGSSSGTRGRAMVLYYCAGIAQMGG
jgi:hypothetical protein